MGALYLLAFCFGICAFFLLGYSVMLAGAAIHAKAHGRCVRAAIQPLLDEW